MEIEILKCDEFSTAQFLLKSLNHRERGKILLCMIPTSYRKGENEVVYSLLFHSGEAEREINTHMFSTYKSN